MIKFHNATGTDGHIIHIDEVTKENRAEHYYCVGCGGEMSAVLGDKREHHFRHKEAHCSWESYLHNPRSCRTADFIFEKKGILGLYDLKTVHGKGSVRTQLLDSIGQTNRVILNMQSDYNARLLASDIKTYFETNQDALEVLIFKGKKVLPVNRIQIQSPDFNRVFRKRYEK